MVERDDWMSEPGGRLTISFANGGAAPLTITLAGDDALGCSVAFTPNALTIAPGERVTVEARLPALMADTMCRWTSNDPDEAIGWLDLRVPSQSLGQPHEDFELMGFTAPNTELTPYPLSDQRGQVVVLFFFAPL